MAIFKSGNPALQEKTFEGTIFQGIDIGQEMTIQGTMKKFGVLFMLMLASALLAWDQFYKGSDPKPFLIIGTFGILILFFIMYRKKEWSPVLGPAVAIVQGLFAGSISAIYDFMFQTKYPGLVMQAIMLTMVVAVVMFVLYYTRIVKVTAKFKSIVIIATASLMIFYLVQAVGHYVFNTQIAAFTSARTPLGIGFSVVVVILAAINLLLDFDMIENGAAKKVPKYMEWFCAAGLLFTLVWLYLEILRLLSKLKD